MRREVAREETTPHRRCQLRRDRGIIATIGIVADDDRARLALLPGVCRRPRGDTVHPGREFRIEANGDR